MDFCANNQFNIISSFKKQKKFMLKLIALIQNSSSLSLQHSIKPINSNQLKKKETEPARYVFRFTASAFYLNVRLRST